METYNEKFRTRTKKLAVDVIKFYVSLKKSDELRIIGKQLIRSVTSVAANFRAATRARSDKEFYAKLCVVIEEADETLFGLELMMEAELIKPHEIENFSTEVTELLSVFSKTRKTINEKIKLLNNHLFTNSPSH